MDIVISDFDNTLFKRNYGVIQEKIDEVASYDCPVIIVSYRAPDQAHFITETLDKTDLRVIALVLLGDRKKVPDKKAEAAFYLSKQYNIVAAFDDEPIVQEMYNHISGV